MKSHWWIIWKMVDGSSVRDSTRSTMDPMTEEDLKEALSSILRPSILQERLEPLIWVTDADREGRPVLVFTAQVGSVELEPDLQEEDPERKLELVQAWHPGQAGPDHGEPVDPSGPGGGLSDQPQVIHPRPGRNLFPGVRPWGEPRMDWPSA